MLVLMCFIISTSGTRLATQQGGWYHGKPCYEYDPGLPALFVNAYKVSISASGSQELTPAQESDLHKSLYTSVDNHRFQTAGKHFKVTMIINI